MQRLLLAAVASVLLLNACSDDSATQPDEPIRSLPGVGSIFKYKGYQYSKDEFRDTIPGSASMFTLTIVEKGISFEGKTGVWKSVIRDDRTGQVSDSLYMCFDGNKDVLLFNPRIFAQINATLPADSRRLSWIRLPVATRPEWTTGFYRDTISTTGVYNGKSVQRGLLCRAEAKVSVLWEFGSGKVATDDILIHYSSEFYPMQGSVRQTVNHFVIQEAHRYAPSLGVFTHMLYYKHMIDSVPFAGRKYELQSYTLK